MAKDKDIINKKQPPLRIWRMDKRGAEQVAAICERFDLLIHFTTIQPESARKETDDAEMPS